MLLPGRSVTVDPTGSELAVVVRQGDSLAVGYASDLREISRVRPVDSATVIFSVIGTDLREDGLLDAASLSRVTVDGVPQSRLLVYDASGHVFVDTSFASDRATLGRWTYEGFIDARGRYTLLIFYSDGADGTVALTLRSDTGERLTAEDSGRYVFGEGCYRGRPYLLSLDSEGRFRNTLHSVADGSPEVTLPAGIRYDGDSAALLLTVEPCGSDPASGVSLCYDQEARQRLLFTDAAATVLAELPYGRAAYPLLGLGGVYAYADRAADGRAAAAVFRIGEGVSTSADAPPALSLELWPNPASERFAIRADAAPEGFGVEVLDALGRRTAAYARVPAGETLPAPEQSGVYSVVVRAPDSEAAATRLPVVR